MKLMICGYARHGKDSAAEYLAQTFGLSHDSSSHIAMRHFLRDELFTRYGLLYHSEEDCYADRVNHRAKWFDVIAAYNREDPAKLSRLIFSQADVYVGIRNREEFYAAKKDELFDLSLWVHAPRRHPPEPLSSNTLCEDDCDLVIMNNGTKQEFENKLDRLFRQILRR